MTERIKYATLGGSHLTQVLRLWNANTKCPKTPHLGVNGFLEKSILIEKDPAYYDAIVNGMKYHVVDESVCTEFPSFCSLCQAAENARQQAHVF